MRIERKILTGAVKYKVLRIAAAAAVAFALVPYAHAAGIISLQNAYNIGVVGLISATVTNNASDTVAASEGIATGGTLGGTGTIQGNVYVGNSVSQASNCGYGCVVDSSDLGSSGTLVNDASADASAAAAQTPTQAAITSDITSSRTITATSGLAENVIAFTGGAGIDLSGSTSNLTLSGSASDYFVLQISGSLILSNDASITLTGGLLPRNVLIVFTGTSPQSITLSGGTINGTLLADNTNYSMTLAGTVDGIVLGDHAITLDNLTVNADDAWAGAPEPGTWAMLVGGLAGLGSLAVFRRKRKNAGGRSALS
jgi:Ice-binding-like/PEP-CTERM motif